MEKPKSVAAYFRSLPKDQRVALQTLRETITAAAPEAQEGITYSMPGFLLDGHGFVAYAAFKDHYSFFPMSGLAVDAHRNELGDRVTGKGTIQFSYDERFPTGLDRRKAAGPRQQSLISLSPPVFLARQRPTTRTRGGANDGGNMCA